MCVCVCVCEQTVPQRHNYLYSLYYYVLFLLADNNQGEFMCVRTSIDTFGSSTDYCM